MNQESSLPENFQNETNFIKKQPLLSLAAAMGTVNAALRKIKRNTSINLFKIPRRYTRFVPKYLRSTYIAVPTLLIILLASTQKIRSALAQ